MVKPILPPVLDTLRRIAAHIEELIGEYEERAAEERIAARQAEAIGPLTARLRQAAAERHAGTALGLALALSAVEAEIERLQR